MNFYVKLIPLLQVTFNTPLKKPSLIQPETPARKYEEIRALDEEERWAERTQVITKKDHADYIHVSAEIISEIINAVPSIAEENSIKNKKVSEEQLVDESNKQCDTLSAALAIKSEENFDVDCHILCCEPSLPSVVLAESVSSPNEVVLPKLENSEKPEDIENIEAFVNEGVPIDFGENLNVTEEAKQPLEISVNLLDFSHASVDEPTGELTAVADLVTSSEEPEEDSDSRVLTDINENKINLGENVVSGVTPANLLDSSIPSLSQPSIAVEFTEDSPKDLSNLPEVNQDKLLAEHCDRPLETSVNLLDFSLTSPDTSVNVAANDLKADCKECECDTALRDHTPSLLDVSLSGAGESTNANCVASEDKFVEQVGDLVSVTDTSLSNEHIETELCDTEAAKNTTSGTDIVASESPVTVVAEDTVEENSAVQVPDTAASKPVEALTTETILSPLDVEALDEDLDDSDSADVTVIAADFENPVPEESKVTTTTGQCITESALPETVTSKLEQTEEQAAPETDTLAVSHTKVDVLDEQSKSDFEKPDAVTETEVKVNDSVITNEPTVDLSESENQVNNSDTFNPFDEIPIKKGSYVINWDEIDEFTNPFDEKVRSVTKVKKQPEENVSGQNCRKNLFDDEPNCPPEKEVCVIKDVELIIPVNGEEITVEKSLDFFEETAAVVKVCENRDSIKKKTVSESPLKPLNVDEIPLVAPSTMADGDIPLPKGTYNINWDEIDENTNPFETRTKVTSNTPLRPMKETSPSAEPVDNSMPVDKVSPVNEESEKASDKVTKKPVSKKPVTKKDVNGEATAEEKKPKAARSSIRDQIKAARAAGAQKKNADAMDDVALFVPTNNNDKNTESLENTAVSASATDVNSNSQPNVDNTNNSADSDAGKVETNTRVVSESDALDTNPMRDSGIGDSPNANKHNTAKAPSLVQDGAAVNTVQNGTVDAASSEDNQRVTADSSAHSFATALSSGEEEFFDSESGTTIPQALLPSINGMTESAMTATNEFPADGTDFPEEDFKPAVEVMNALTDPNELDYLENVGGGNDDFKASALARQSLYRKFDPLVEHESPDVTGRKSILAGGPDVIQTSENFLLMGTPPSGQNSLPGAIVGQTAKAGQKPMLDYSIMNMTALGQPSSALSDENSELLKYSEKDLQQVILEWQARQLTRDQQWDKRCKDLEAQVQEDKLQTQEQLAKQEKSSREMKVVMSDYEKTISQLIAEKERHKSETTENVSELIQERDQVLEDMQNVEKAFSDLHKRYEKMKSVVDALKKNEDTLKHMVEEYQAKLKRQEQRYQDLKMKAEEKLENAVKEIENVKKSTASDVAILAANVKRYEIKIDNLEKTLEQKTKENQELSNICDDLIAKVKK